MLALVLLVFAFVCFVLAALPVSSPYYPRLVAAGLAFWAAVELFGNGVALYSHGGFGH